MFAIRCSPATGSTPAVGFGAQLDSFVRLAQELDAVVYVDDAHGIGVLGSRLGALPLGHGGAGSPAFCGVRAGNHVHVGGLSKAFGVPVAFVAGPERFTDHLRLTASAFMASAYRPRRRS